MIKDAKDARDLVKTYWHAVAVIKIDSICIGGQINK